MKYKFADFNIEINSRFKRIHKQCEDFCVSCDILDKTIDIKFVDTKYEREMIGINYIDSYLESAAAYRKLADWLPLHNAFVLHSATFDVDGVGVAFAAHSGTGKTTHMRLWQELLGERMVVVNGDKPIVRFFDDEPECPYAYGTPWNGKEGLGCNMRTPLKHICFIERSLTNSCEPMDKKDAVDLMFNQVYMPTDPQAAMCTMQLIDRLLSSCKLWKIKCNMEPQAAEVAYNTIFAE